MLFGEISFFAGFEVDHADEAVLDDERDSELGVNVGHGFDIEIFASHIGDENGLAGLSGAPGNALADFDADAFGDFVGIADMEANIELLQRFVKQEDGENLVVDNFADKLRDATQSGLEVERGVDHVGDFEQKRFHLRRAQSWRGVGFHKHYDSSRLICNW